VGLLRRSASGHGVACGGTDVDGGAWRSSEGDAGRGEGVSGTACRRRPGIVVSNLQGCVCGQGISGVGEEIMSG
jgi:hypothetical protein